MQAGQRVSCRVMENAKGRYARLRRRWQAGRRGVVTYHHRYRHCGLHAAR